MLFNDKRWLKLYENIKVSGFADKCCDKMSITRGRVSEKRDAENIQTRKTQCFQAMGVLLGGLAPLTPPFKQGVRSSNLRRVTKSSEHFGSMGQKPSDFKVFGIFYDRKFSEYSMDQWKRYRGSNRVWTSVFPYSRDFCCQRPFSEGCGGWISEKSEKNLSQSYGRWIVGFDEPMTSALFVCPKAQRIYI